MSAALPPLTEDVLKALSRSAIRAGRGSVVLVPQDLRAVEELTGSRVRSHKVIQQLEDAGRLRPVRRGVYVVASVTGVIDVDLLALVDVVTPRPYLVTAGRALAHHGLSDQQFRTTVVLSPRRMSPWTWRGERARYAQVPIHRLWGGSDVKLRGGGRVRIASRQRAILDSLAHPGWGVSLSQVTEALDVATRADVAFAGELAAQAARYGNASVSRRIGFLLSRLYGPDIAEPFLPLRGTTKGPVLLSSSGARSGRVDTGWGVRENVDFAMVANHRRAG
jgi:predicted transcriptional regulator of viral defense system